MFRIILLTALAPLLIACQTNSGAPAVDTNPNAEMGEAVAQPTDGIDNEITTGEVN